MWPNWGWSYLWLCADGKQTTLPHVSNLLAHYHVEVNWLQTGSILPSSWLPWPHLTLVLGKLSFENCIQEIFLKDSYLQYDDLPGGIRHKKDVRSQGGDCNVLWGLEVEWTMMAVTSTMYQPKIYILNLGSFNDNLIFFVLLTKGTFKCLLLHFCFWQQTKLMFKQS